MYHFFLTVQNEITAYINCRVINLRLIKLSEKLRREIVLCDLQKINYHLFTSERACLTNFINFDIQIKLNNFFSYNQSFAQSSNVLKALKF